MVRILVTLIIVLLSSSLYAFPVDILLHYNIQKGIIRIVLQSDNEELIQKAKVRSSYTLISVEFPEKFVISPLGETKVEYKIKDKSIFFNIKRLRNIKILKLQLPNRLVIDALLHEETPREGITRNYLDKEPSSEVLIPDTLPSEEIRLKNPVSVVVLDPGHGGYDLGIYTPTYSEKNFVSNIVKKLGERLEDKNKKVFLTRNDDRYISIMDRILFIKEKNPDLLISLHMTSSNHISIYTSIVKEGKGYLLSRSQNNFIPLSKLFAKKLGISLRGKLNLNVFYRELDIPVLSYLNNPAILIEMPSPEFFDYNEPNVDLIIDLIIEGILNYEKED